MLRHLFRALLQRPAPVLPAGAAQDQQGQAHQLVLYKFDACPYCQRLMQVVGELQVPLEFKDIRNNPSYREELIKIGGKGMTPCLLIDGQPLYESLDIIAYLRKHYS